MSNDSDPVHMPGDVIVVERGSGGRQIAMISHWNSDRHFRAWKFLATTNRWSTLKTLHVESIVGPIEIHAKKGPMRAAIVAARKVGFPTVR